jgi:hypothetical protein
MEDTGGRGRRVSALPLALIAAAITWLAAVETTFAAGNPEGQARGLLRAVVSRAAFKHTVGVGFDLPLTLPACTDNASKTKAYEDIDRIIRQKGFVRGFGAAKTQPPACHPYHEQVQDINSDEKKVSFILPAEHCPAIRKLVIEVLEDWHGDVYKRLVDRNAQLRIKIPFEDTRDVFPATSSSGYSRYFLFAVGECVHRDHGIQLEIKMKRRS